ncbi:MAG: S-methyl-5'-thioadenosine phosphorylase [Planctomycetota bacterium]
MQASTGDPRNGKPRIGIIGGSGLYDMPGLKILQEVRVATAWGAPSDALVYADVDGVPVVFLPRHGRGHRVLPSEVNSRANIAALKLAGVEQVIAFSAVGSLKESLEPLDFVVPAQLIDRTRQRASTYFGGGVVGHVAFADPFCHRLADLVHHGVIDLGLPGGQRGETLVVMEGPLFSTRAESQLYRSWGAGLINMSTLPEAKLAREAEICYCVVCMVTDYDCWKASEADVDIQMVLENLRQNADNARRLVLRVVAQVARAPRQCACADACRYAIVTSPEHRNPEAVRRLRTLLPRYFE